MRYLISILAIFTLFAFFAGCSSSSDLPTQPGNNQLPQDEISDGNSQLLYSGTFEINLDSLNITQTDNRQSEFVYDITGFLPDKCPGGCFRFTIVGVVGTVLEIEFTLENPLAIQAYDLKVEYLELFGKTVLNPDSYTDFLGTPITNIFPFTAFMKEDPDRAFPLGPGGIDTETLFLDFPPGSGASVNYAITAHLPGQTPEPYEISEMSQDGELTPEGGLATISCKVDDHQDDVSYVFLDSTPFTGAPVQLQENPLNPGYYEIEISNTEEAAVGIYNQLMMALSPNPQTISIYNYVEISVTEPSGGWKIPVLLDNNSHMPRAAVDTNADLYAIWHKDNEGIRFSYDDGSGWNVPETTYNHDPYFLHLTKGDDDALVYAGYKISDPISARRAIRHIGGGVWEHKSNIGNSGQPACFIPDDDGSYIALYTHSGGFEIAQYPNWVDSGWPTTWADGSTIYMASTNFLERDDTNHYVGYRRSTTDIDYARLMRISKATATDRGHTDIFVGEAGDIVDSTAISFGTNYSIHAVYRHYDGTNYKIGYAKSTDNGATWPTPEIILSTTEEILKDYVGIATDSTGTIYITYAEGTDPGTIPPGYHYTQPYPIVTPDDVLHIFFIDKGEIFNVGNLFVVMYD
jgi:hypothetical protein